MKRLLISGINGRMGKLVYENSKSENLNVVCGVDKKIIGNADCPVYKNFSEVKDYVDLIIDFSSADNLSDLLDFSLKSLTPTVICTTGHSEEQIKKIKKYSENFPIFFSPNTSKGIPIMALICKEISEKLDDFELEIIETHHKDKKDVPSGTALKLYKSVSGENLILNVGRKTKRTKNEVGIHCVRGGRPFGEHECIFFFGDEMISIKHTAFSSEVFAIGALKAGNFILGKKNGLYSEY